MSKRKNTRTSMDRLNKVKRSNQQLRTLASRQRRNIKDLVSIITQARRAVENGDMLRCVAIMSVNIKYPPSAAVDCKHDWQYMDIRKCRICNEEWN